MHAYMEIYVQTCVSASRNVGLCTQRFVYKLCVSARVRHRLRFISYPSLFTAFPHTETVKEIDLQFLHTRAYTLGAGGTVDALYPFPPADSKAPVSPRFRFKRVRGACLFSIAAKCVREIVNTVARG